MPYDQKLLTRIIAKSQELNDALLKLFEIDPKDPAKEELKRQARQLASDAIRTIWRIIPHDAGVRETPDDVLEKMYPEMCGALEMVKFLVDRGVRKPPPLDHALVVAALKKLT